MKHDVQFDITPEKARMLIRLKDIYPDTIIDPVIYEIAKTTTVSSAGLDNESAQFLDDIVGLNMRAVVALQTKMLWNAHNRLHIWYEPVLRACEHFNIKDICVTRGRFPVRFLVDDAKQRGIAVHDLAPNILEDGCTIPRDALLITFPDHSSITYVGEVSPLTLEFPRTLIFSDRMIANSVQLFPRTTTFTSALSRNDAILGMKKSTEISFLFGVTTALSKVTF